MPKSVPKIIIINNEKPIREAIDIIWENEEYQNHLQYWEEYLKRKTFDGVSIDDIYSNTRNIIGVKIALEGNFVFIDTSRKFRNYKSGIIFLPDNAKTPRQKLLELFTFDYQYLNIISDIKIIDGSLQAKEKDIIRYQETDNKVKKYRLQQ